MGVVKALRAFKDQHNALPTRIFVYRGGVGEGDIKYVRDVEVKAMEAKLKFIYEKENQELQMVFIVVTKRINTRIFANGNNPQAGTVVDSDITLPERYNFLIINEKLWFI